MMVANIRLDNPSEAIRFIQHLRETTSTLQGRILEALHYVGSEMQNKIKQAASTVLDTETGKLQRSIFYTVKVKKAGSVYVLTAGVARRAYYAAFQEKGVPLRFIEIKKGKRRYHRFLYLKARPFIGPSIESMATEIQNVIAEAFRGGVTDGP